MSIEPLHGVNMISNFAIEYFTATSSVFAELSYVIESRVILFSTSASCVQSPDTPISRRTT